MWYQSVSCVFFRFVTKHAYVGQTDERTDTHTEGRNYDPQDRASIAGSRSKKHLKTYLFRQPLMSRRLRFL